MQKCLRKKIVSDQYVNLKVLLNPHESNDINIKLRQGKGAPEIAVSGVDNGSEISNIHQWTDAFCVYSAIYTESHPEAAPALFKYMHTVRDVARSRGDWRQFDEQFRKKRESRTRPFDQVDWMLMWRFGGNPQHAQSHSQSHYQPQSHYMGC